VLSSSAGVEHTAELMIWHRASSEMPVALARFEQLGPYSTKVFTDNNLPPIGEAITRLFPDDVQVGDVGDARNAVGEGEYARFAVAAHECVFFRVFDGATLPSGTYLYRLETPQGSFVGTMLLVK